MDVVREPGPEGYRIDAPEVQAALALYAYREQLKRKGGCEDEVRNIVINDPQGNAEDIVNKALESWILEDANGDSPSKRYAQYCASHSQEYLNTGNDEAVAELLAKLDPIRH